MIQALAHYAVWGLIGFLALLTLLPFSRLSHGAVRVADFPRIQVFCLALILILAAPIALDGRSLTVALSSLLMIIGIQAAYILRFTPLWVKQSLRATVEQSKAIDRRVSILAVNIKKSNRHYSRLISLVEEINPDILILIEVDAAWLAGVSNLRVRYQTHFDHPLDNGYGMSVWSKLVLFETELRELLVTDVPSLRTGVMLRSGERVRLYVVHPEPPIPTQGTEGRDGEIGLVGIEVQEDPLPAIVTGDLNDVAWSSTTRRFQRLSSLLDPRVGRGFYNTFDARNPIIRWPLDHLFHDAKFRLIEMRRLPHIGSDHFPIYFNLAMTDVPMAEEVPPDASEEDIAEIEELVEAEEKQTRDPIGANWEDET